MHKLVFYIATPSGTLLGQHTTRTYHRYTRRATLLRYIPVVYTYASHAYDRILKLKFANNPDQ